MRDLVLFCTGLGVGAYVIYRNMFNILYKDPRDGHEGRPTRP